MLIKENAIRTEWYKSSKSNRLRLYIFICNCGKELKIRPSYLSRHSGICKSCNGKKTIKKAQVSNRLRPYESKFNLFKTRCPETDLNYEDYLKFVGTDCHYCERKLPWQPFGENNPGFWLDRKDNNIGHLKMNLVTCCGICNNTKRDEFTYEEFMLLATVLKQIRELRQEHL